jgi:puromycin-sensitive aminopeptidase
VTTTIESTSATSGNPYRLPRSASPSRYTLTLEPNLAAGTFTGSVDIAVNVNAAVRQLVLNAIELDISQVMVDGDAVPFALDETTERLVLDAPFDASFDVGTVLVSIEFTGILNDKLRGWYRSTYRDGNGDEQVIATTQMQATDCRRAFPCFDEPDFKAVFDITLVIEPHLLAVSNGPELTRRQTSGGKVSVRFKETMPMSTYLVAFVVGPLEATEPVLVESANGGTIPLRIVHVPGKAHLTEFGLDVGAHALRWYQHYYGIAYPTDKCDMLALPDFAAGAMENLGCITYRENLLLADPATATQIELQTLADVVTHEMAHMWFGDLVTMKWWNGIWLNEAFATFMEIACCDAFKPEWQRWTTFSLERSVAFETDSLANTRSVEYPVEAPHDCDGMFDVLTYQKGGSLLRMLEQYLGEEEFRVGVSHYLTKHEYGNTETGDLWDGIEEANSGTAVRALMDSWIWQPGYPLVSARIDGRELVLEQRRFSFDDSQLDDAGAATLFMVPVHLRIGDVESKVLLERDELRIALTEPAATIVVNAGGHGFMRVAYDDSLRARLVGDALSGLTVIDRYNLVDDAWNAVVAGRLPAADYVTFAEGFTSERDLAVWQAIAVALRCVGRLVDGQPYAAFQLRVAALVSPALAELGWEPAAGETELTKKLRGLLVGVLAVLGNDSDAQRRCRTLLEAALADPAAVDPELVSAATNAVASSGTDADYDRYLASFRSATTPQEQLRYMYALAEFPEAAQIQRTIDLALSGEVKTQNAPFLLNRCIANRFNGLMAWNAVRQHWAEANEKFPDNTIVRMVDPVKLLTAPEVVADVQSFFSEHPIPQGAKTLEQILERQRINAALRAREAGPLADALG